MSTENLKAAGEASQEGRGDAVAALAGGLAHDLNNVLSAALMMVDLLEKSCPGERERSVLAAMEESARRGVALVRQLTWLARGAEEEVTLFQPKYLLGDLRQVARAILPASIAVTSEFPPDLYLLRGDPFRIYRLLLDLCLAARDSLHAGGELAISAKNLDLDEIAAAQRPGAAAGPYVVLEVAASAGVSAFSNAAAGAVPDGAFHEIAARAQGGQAFRIFLPAVPNQADEGKPLAAEVEAASGELVLVADGDGAAREAIAGVLEKHGYRAETAADGAEAVALFARSPQAVAAVVAAAELPYLDGPGVLRAIRRLRAGVPAVLTGGAGAAATAEDPSAPIVLAKPFTAPELLAALRRALGG